MTADGPAEAATAGEPRGPAFRMTRRWRIALSAAALVLVVLGVAVVWLLRQLDPPGAPGAPVTIEVSEGASTSRIADLLDERGVITSSTVFRFYVRVRGSGDFRAGIYNRGELRENMSMGDVVAALTSGPEIAYTRLTIPEGFTLGQIADRVDDVPGLSGDVFHDLARSGSVRSRYSPQGQPSLEGLLFPDTYLVAEGESERGLLERMVGLFDKIVDDLGIEEKAASAGLSTYEAVVLASLVEEETKVASERTSVSSVIHNRLEIGMLLQIDATVLYSLGEHRERVLLRDLEVDSPYNTYRNEGLPPTPIAAPGRASLRAAVEPADTDYLFYVKVDEDGSHAFAEDEAGHRANIAEARRRGVR